MGKIKLVVLDFDDTLSISEEACMHMENEIAEMLGFPPQTHAEHLKNWGKPLETSIAERFPGIDVDKFMDLFEPVHMRHIMEGKIDAISGESMQFLDDVLEAGYRLAILTSRSVRELRHLLETDHPINFRVERIYHKNNTTYVKPDPRVFDGVLKDFGMMPEETVYVGDALTDAHASKKAGLHFIACLESGFKTEKDFEGEQVDFFAMALPEALTYIKGH